MIEEDRYCADIIQQAAAVQESLRSVAKNLLRNHLTHCAAAAMHEDGPKRDDMIEELLRTGRQGGAVRSCEGEVNMSCNCGCIMTNRRRRVGGSTCP
jgi:DNA-binding FrmR family transcriptional regulator